MGKKSIGETLKSAVVTAIGYAVGGPAGAAVASGGYNYSKTHDLKSAAMSAAGSYFGGKIGANVLGPEVGSIGSNISPANAVGPYFINPGLSSVVGQTANNAIGATVANANLGSAIGSYYGSNAMGDMAAPKPTASAAPPAFSPTRQEEKEAPTSLTGLGSLTSDQLSSNIATQGVYGGGSGPQENDYFLNLVNRKLVDDSGNMSDTSNLSPIEMSYLQKLGLGGYGDSRSLLEAISNYKAA